MKLRSRIKAAARTCMWSICIGVIVTWLTSWAFAIVVQLGRGGSPKGEPQIWSWVVDEQTDVNYHIRRTDERGSQLVLITAPTMHGIPWTNEYLRGAGLYFDPSTIPAWSLASWSRYFVDAKGSTTYWEGRAYGWPFPALYEDRRRGSDNVFIRDHSLHTRLGANLEVRLPLAPVWGGLLANIAIWSGACLAFAAIRHCASSLRARPGACRHCGYDLRSGGLSRCPECGRTADTK